MRYICNKYPQAAKFYPQDHKVDIALDFRQGTLYANIAKVAYPKFGFSKDQSTVEPGTKALAEAFAVLENYFLAGRHFIGGDSVSIADFAIAPALIFLNPTGVVLPEAIKAYQDRVAAACASWNETTAVAVGFVSNFK